MIKDRTGDAKHVELHVKERTLRRKSIPESQRDGRDVARKSKIGGRGGDESVL